MEQVNVLLAGIGGYGENYIKELLSTQDQSIRIAGIADPFAGRSPYFEAIKSGNIPVFNDVDDFYRTNTADLTVIASPIHTHYRYIDTCLKNKSNVLCEKPICGDLDQIDDLIKTEKESGLFAAVGFQLDFSRDVLALKRDILDGLYGRPRLLKTMWLTRRNTKYYRRNKWAGMINYDGEKILDSPLNNACAHLLQIMLFLLGSDINTSVDPEKIDARLWKARPDIENYDAAAVEIESANGKMLYFTAHCLEENMIGPAGDFLFEKGSIAWRGGNIEQVITARFHDGSTKSYAELNTRKTLQKFYDAVECVKHNTRPVCTLETAKSHSLCVDMIQKQHINSMAPEKVRKLEGTIETECYVIPGLGKEFSDCYNNNKLPSINCFL
jgi:predicted dehydrogenase